jgi:hypothetical protein
MAILAEFRPIPGRSTTSARPNITGKSVANPVTIPGRYALTENGPA